MIAESNEYMLSNFSKKDDDDDEPKPPAGSGTSNDNSVSGESEKKGTLILDATCAPVNIRYPQDVSLLNEAREKLETIIYCFHKSYGLELPRRYVKRAHKDYLAFAKCKKRTMKKIRKALCQQLAYVRRDIGYFNDFMSDGYAPKLKERGIVFGRQEIAAPEFKKAYNKLKNKEITAWEAAQMCGLYISTFYYRARKMKSDNQ